MTFHKSRTLAGRTRQVGLCPTPTGGWGLSSVIHYMSTSLTRNRSFPQDPGPTRHGPAAGSQGAAVSYERGAPVLWACHQKNPWLILWSKKLFARELVDRHFLPVKKTLRKPASHRSCEIRNRKKAVGPRVHKVPKTHKSGRAHPPRTPIGPP